LTPTIAASGNATFTVQPAAALGAGTYNATIFVTYNNVGSSPATVYVTFTVNRAAGAAVGVPTVSGTPTQNSITVNTVPPPGNGQNVEYAISTLSNGTGLSAWQSGTTFTGLASGTTYYVYARSAEGSNHYAGAASVSAGIVTGVAGVLPIEMVRINPGSFMMGSPNTEPGHFDSEGPQHQVTLTSGFWIGIYPVTQAQFQTVMGTNPSNFTTSPGGNPGNLPVEQVSWYDAIVFCNRLSLMNGRSPAYEMQTEANTAVWSADPSTWGTVPTSSNVRWNAVRIVTGSNGYRLPTDAQWEYACRAGSTAAFNWGTDVITDTQANYLAGVLDYNNLAVGTFPGRTTEVGSYAPNAWGLYDKHGNVYEWCWDGQRRYETSMNDPVGPLGAFRVVRGGSWNHLGRVARSAYRLHNNPNAGTSNVGFRVLRP
jgi:formylglycine-generating enzyme required for sulfatase activity